MVVRFLSDPLANPWLASLFVSLSRGLELSIFLLLSHMEKFKSLLLANLLLESLCAVFKQRLITKTLMDLFLVQSFRFMVDLSVESIVDRSVESSADLLVALSLEPSAALLSDLRKALSVTLLSELSAALLVDLSLVLLRKVLSLTLSVASLLRNSTDP